MKETTTKTRRDGLLPYRLASPSLTQLAYVVFRDPGWVIPKTIIKLIKPPPCLIRMRRSKS